MALPMEMSDFGRKDHTGSHIDEVKKTTYNVGPVLLLSMFFIEIKATQIYSLVLFPRFHGFVLSAKHEIRR